MPEPIRDQLATRTAAWLFDFTMRQTNVDARWADDEIGAGAIADSTLRRAWHYEAGRLLDELLPLVQSYVDQQAAKALRDAADDVNMGGDYWSPRQVDQWLRDRAAALDPNGDPR